LEELTGTTPEKLNSSNLGTVMKTCGKIGPEGIVDMCIEQFNKIMHLEVESSTLIYDITSTYSYSTKFLFSLKSKRRLLESLGLRMHSFRVVAYTTLKVRF
jgi:hypothetical protein